MLWCLFQCVILEELTISFGWSFTSRSSFDVLDSVDAFLDRFLAWIVYFLAAFLQVGSSRLFRVFKLAAFCWTNLTVEITRFILVIRFDDPLGENTVWSLTDLFIVRWKLLHTMTFLSGAAVLLLRGLVISAVLGLESSYTSHLSNRVTPDPAAAAVAPTGKTFPNNHKSNQPALFSFSLSRGDLVTSDTVQIPW